MPTAADPPRLAKLSSYTGERLIFQMALKERNVYWIGGDWIEDFFFEKEKKEDNWARGWEIEIRITLSQYGTYFNFFFFFL